jgi:hypothetical protein
MAGTDIVIHKAMLWGVKMGMAQRGDPVRRSFRYTFQMHETHVEIGRCHVRNLGAQDWIDQHYACSQVRWIRGLIKLVFLFVFKEKPRKRRTLETRKRGGEGEIYKIGGFLAPKELLQFSSKKHHTKNLVCFGFVQKEVGHV